MKEEKTLEEQLRNLRISEDDPEVLRKKIQELEKENQSLKQRPNIAPENEEEIYNKLVNAYENTQINENLFAENNLKAMNKYKRGLEKELSSMDNINEEIIQRISNYIDKKHIFNGDSAKAGVFLTKLIDISPLTEITLKLEKGLDIDFFGYGFAGKKKIIVDGNLGRDVGNRMEAGELEINGNVKDFCGLVMRGGKIVVHGNANEYCGMGMERGKIVVHGNVNEEGCGCIMKGGTIEIDGNTYGDVAENMEGGKIHIEGYVSGACGYGMKSGVIEIDEYVSGKCGGFMEGGTIHINGDQKPKLYTEKGWFVDKITKTGGSVYHKNKLIG